MKSVIPALFGILFFAVVPASASAQETGDYHPFLSDKFHIGVGIFAPQKSFGLSYSNFDLNVDVDKNDWHGQVETRQHGPILSVTAVW